MKRIRQNERMSARERAARATKARARAQTRARQHMRKKGIVRAAVLSVAKHIHWLDNGKPCILLDNNNELTFGVWKIICKPQPNSSPEGILTVSVMIWLNMFRFKGRASRQYFISHTAQDPIVSRSTVALACNRFPRHVPAIRVKQHWQQNNSNPEIATRP